MTCIHCSKPTLMQLAGRPVCSKCIRDGIAVPKIHAEEVSRPYTFRKAYRCPMGNRRSRFADQTDVTRSIRETSKFTTMGANVWKNRKVEK